MKKNNNGFVLAETLIVTTFVAGILIYIFIQFTNLSQKYNESYIYNTVEGLYALEDIKDYVESDDTLLDYIKTNIDNQKIIDIKDCSIFETTSYCSDLFEYENIDQIFISTNEIDLDFINNYKSEFKVFIKKIEKQGDQKYRIVASFNNGTFATIRFGE